MSLRISLAPDHSRARKSLYLLQERKPDMQVLSHALGEFPPPERYTGNPLYTIKNIFAAPLCILAAVIIISLLPGSRLHAQADEPDSLKRILVLDSYHPTDYWAEQLIKGIKARLAEHHDRIELNIEYMDARNINNEKHHENLYALYKHKTTVDKNKQKSYDVIVVADDVAFEFLLKHRNELYPDVPVVFCGVNLNRNNIDSMLENQDLITGVIEANNYAATIETALKFHPQANHMVVIADINYMKPGQLLEVHEAMQKYNDRFTFTTFQLAEICKSGPLKTIEALGDESVVLLAGEISNLQRRQHKSLQALRYKCIVPIYVVWKEWVDTGLAVGGMVTSSYFHGREAAKMAMRILDGEKAEDIPIMSKGANKYMFNYEQLEKFNISHTHLPKDSIILNMPQSFYYKYKTHIYTIAAIIATLTVIVIILSANNLRRRRAEQQLRKARDELEIRVRQRTAELVDSNKTLQGEIKERTKIEALLLDSQNRLRSLASELSLSEERLRHKMAVGIHDHIGQNLAISKIKLESLAESLSISQFSDTIEETLELISETIESARSLSFELSPSILYELGFEAAIEWLLRRTRERDGLSVEFENDGQTKPLADDVRVLLFQGVRELLVNIVKHSHAEKVKVTVKRVNSRIQVTVEDNGIGFDLSKISNRDYSNRGFGLFSIQERLGYIGGSVDINSTPGRGTRIMLDAPLKTKRSDNKIKELISSIREKANEHKNIISR